MSPEQARGEGHLVDGRSDVFGLGVVFYELLTGERPFTGSSWQEIAERIKTLEVRPPRQRDDTIPKELERICLKCLSKRASDRYSTAADLSEDLRHFLQQGPAQPQVPVKAPKIFLSYRREDSDVFTGRLCENLRHRYGRDAVFFDVTSMPFGVDFPTHIAEKISQSDVLLAVIGPQWSGPRGDGSRRIDQEQDYVRIEVELALGPPMSVIPIRVGTTPMPAEEELPHSLRPLAKKNAYRIDTGGDFTLHAQRLIEDLDRIPPRSATEVGGAVIPSSPPLPKRPAKIIPRGLRSYDDLLSDSGYADRPEDFGTLIRILNSELRLITPTDPAGADLDEDSAEGIEPGRKYYQLTHDYLVPSLRRWLRQKETETYRGRAELRLTDRAALWKAEPEDKQLPAWWEWLDIRLLTNRGHWTESQQKMMRRATKVHGVRWGSGLLMVLLIGITVQQMLVSSKRNNACVFQTQQLSPTSPRRGQQPEYHTLSSRATRHRPT